MIKTTGILSLRNYQYKLLGLLAPLATSVKGKALRVLAYHTVPNPAAYRAQLLHLKQNYSVISLQQLLEAIQEGRPLPNRAVLITFDDGDRTVYDNALPLHRELALPAVLFVITDLIGTDAPFWWKKVERHYLATGRSYQAARQKVNELKQIDDERRRDYLATITESYPQQQITREELGELHRGGIAIANHTATHPLLNRCSIDRIRVEIAGAANYLQSVDHALPHIFAYPNGNADETTEEELREQGIKLAFLFDHKVSPSATGIENPLRISRIRVNTYDPLSEFKAKVSGVHSVIYHKEWL